MIAPFLRLSFAFLTFNAQTFSGRYPQSEMFFFMKEPDKENRLQKKPYFHILLLRF